MNDLQVFNFNENKLRTVIQNGEPYFVAIDACEALAFSNPSETIKRLDEDEVISIEVTDNLGRKQMTNAVSESGLYSLILGSRKPEAKQFKRWITHEVIPTIRKTGGYVNDSRSFIENYFPSMDQTAKTVLYQSLEEVRKSRQQLEDQKPLVAFAETCLASKTSILVRELAKIAQKQGISIGEKTLWKKLREWGLVLKFGTEPSQYAMGREYFEVIQRAISAVHDTLLTRTTKVTPKGQVYIIERLKKESKAGAFNDYYREVTP